MDGGAGIYRRFLQGDESAFTELLNLYRDSLIFFINRMVHNLDTAEELAADCFVELLVHPGRYRFQGSLKTYLFTRGHHKAVNAVRRAARLRVEELDESAVSASFEAFEENILRDEQRAAVHRGLAKLKPEYREALHLLYFEEMSYEEAARVMHKNRKQIDNLACRGRSALKNILEQEGFSR